jgi:hypothetical protein
MKYTGQKTGQVKEGERNRGVCEIMIRKNRTDLRVELQRILSTTTIS